MAQWDAVNKKSNILTISYYTNIDIDGLNVGWVSTWTWTLNENLYISQEETNLRKKSKPSSCQCEYDFIKHLGGIIHIIIYNKTYKFLK